MFACKSTSYIARLLLSALLCLSPTLAMADRPAAPKILPRSTLAYLRVDDTKALLEAFRKTSAGRIANDEQIRPLLMHLYGSLTQAFANAEGELGLSLEQILSIPQGELCVALVAPEQGRPAVAAIIDAGENLPVAEQLIEFARRQATSDGATVSTENINGTDMHVFSTRDGQSPAYCIRESTVVIVSDADLGRQMIAVWDGQEAPTLADNRRFTTIMSRSQGTKDERPHLTWFVEPVDLAKRLTRGNLGASTMMALLPALGLDGLQAVGGSVILSTEEFDSIMHLHVMLESPREGVLKMIALTPGDITPEPWVPRDVAGYMTVHWDAQQTYDALLPVFDTFRGEGAMEAAIERRINEPLGVDFHEDLLSAFDGRLTLVTWMEKPARLNSQSTMIALKMKDGGEFSKTLDKIMTNVAPNAEKKSMRGVTYYRFEPPRRRRLGQDENGAENPLLRQPEPAVAVVGDYVVLTDSVKMLQEVISTQNSEMSLANELDFKLIASKFKQHAYGKKPGMITFNRPEEGMRLLYELATGDTTRGRLSTAAENNGFFRAINEALEQNQLPPFAAIAKYLAPAGGLLISDETGLHYTTFGLKRE